MVKLANLPSEVEAMTTTKHNIPESIRELVVEATSAHNDGYCSDSARQKLVAIGDYINKALYQK